VVVGLNKGPMLNLLNRLDDVPVASGTARRFGTRVAQYQDCHIIGLCSSERITGYDSAMMARLQLRRLGAHQ
jgi:hypothetical protein